MSAAHRHTYKPVDETIFATSAAQPSVRVCSKCGMPKRGSDAEETLANLIRLEGLKTPEREFQFHSSRRWRFDFAWYGHKVAAEVEGGSFIGGHKRGKAYESDCEKANEAALSGWMVLRFTPAMVNDG